MVERLRSENGMTLTELLVAATLTVAIMGTVMTMLGSGLKTEPKVTERSHRIQEARVALERMTRELRQTYSVHTTASSELNFFTYLRPAGSSLAQQRHVLYRCADGECRRNEADTSSEFSGTGTVVVRDITNDDVFSYAPDNINPEMVRVKFVFGLDKSGKTITVEDGVNLRNATNFDD